MRTFNYSPDELCITIIVEDGESATVNPRQHGYFKQRCGAYFAVRIRCIELGYPDLNVEISTKEGQNRPMISRPVLAPNLLRHAHWFSLKLNLKRILNLVDWIAIDLLVRRTCRDNSYTKDVSTIVITIAEHSQQQTWDLECSLILAELQKRRLHDVAIEFGRGSILLQASNALQRHTLHSTPLLHPNKYNGDAFVAGGSIGATGIKASGTAGGVLMLEFADGSKQVYLTTCHHCVVPTNTNLHLETTHRRNILQKFVVEQPSLKDLDESIIVSEENHRRSILEQTQQREVVEKLECGLVNQAYPQPTIQRSILDRPVNALDRARYIFATINLRCEQQKIALDLFKRLASNETCHFLGNLFMTSGVCVKAIRSPIMDWALVAKQNNGWATNHLHRPPHQSYIWQPQSAVVTHSATAVEGQDYFKEGRTTGFTKGQSTGRYASIIRTNFRDEDGSKIDSMSFERSIVGCWAPDARHRADWMFFALEGDSGAWVTDRYGRMVGMIWGRSSYTFLCYFTPYQALVDDIKRMTGAVNVSFPPEFEE